MRTLVRLQLMVGIGLAVLAGIINAPRSGWSFGVGAAAVLLNVVILGLGWFLVIEKKWVAVGAGVIVIKYAILGVLLYFLSRQPWLDLLWFSLGVASLVVTALIYAKREHGL